jgi:hypothetical protein
VIYFTGAGNYGDADGSGQIDNEMLAGESNLISRLGQRTGAKVIAVYPYGLSIGPDNINDPIMIGKIPFDSNRNLRDVIYQAAYGKSPVPKYKAQEIVARLLGETFDLCRDDDYGKGEFDDDALNIMFIGYSGGGQMAYSTSQKLKGILTVDNLVMFGASFRAHDGIGNIGHIWSFVSSSDNFYGLGEQATAFWDFSWHSQNVAGGLYQTANATMCYTEGDTYPMNAPMDKVFGDHIYGYFDENHNFNGFLCYGANSQQLTSRSKTGTRFEAHLEILVDILERRLE